MMMAERNSDSDNPQLYILRLPERIVQETQQLSFRQPWYIDDESSLSPTSPSSSSSSIQLKVNDLVYFPDCATGAGEFEGCYFVGTQRRIHRKKKNNESDQDFFITRLLRASIEQPVFPEQVIQSLLGASSPPPPQWKRLRQLYEPLFERILEEQIGGVSTLADLMGGQDVVEEYWSCPDVGRDLSEKTSRKGLKPNDQEQDDTPSEDAVEESYYVIPLCECTVQHYTADACSSDKYVKAKNRMQLITSSK
jgi:hypothetical protein